MAKKSNTKGKKRGAIVFLVLLGAGFFQFGPFSSYSYDHPKLWHDCRMMADICPSGQAEWLPPGGGNPGSIYAACACDAGVTVGVHAR